MNQTFVFPIPLKCDGGRGGRTWSGKMYRGVDVVNKSVGCRFVSIGGGRSLAFVLKIQISNVVSE